MKISSLLEKYYNNDKSEQTGLLLLDLPTGFGKTYEVLKYIFNNYQKSDRKILFLTELKKNLPHDTTLKKFFDNENRTQEYEKNVVFINSNVDTVLEHFLPNYHLIPEFIAESSECRALKTHIEFFQSLKSKSGSPIELKIQDKIKKEIQTDYEPRFRKFLQKKIYDQAKKKKDRLNLIKKNKDFQWISKVYPASLSQEKKIFFMSINKFLVKNTPLVERSYYFFDKSFLQNALIFIDEFDSSKDVILKQIINNQSLKRIDLVGLFEQIYSSVSALAIPKIFYKNSNSWTEQQFKNPKIKDISFIINNLINEATKINNEYNIHYSVKTFGLNNQKNFLFHDYQYHTIVGNKKNFIYLEQNDIEKVNNIHFVEKSASRKDKPSITEFLGVIKNFINYFKIGAKIIAENYQCLKNESQNPNADIFTFGNALFSFFDELKLTKDQKDYLIDSIQFHQFQNRQRNKKNINKNDFSFYSNGFRYYDFEDSEMHDTKSKIYITDFNTTPEKILLDLASQNFIVGISATAKIDTVVGNYDLKYLRKNLGTNYYELTQDEIKVLKTIFDQRNENYPQINIKFLRVENWHKSLHKLKLSKVATNRLLTLLERHQNPDTQNFELKRYLKIAKVYQEFLVKDDIQSFLCFLNTHPSNKDDSGCQISVLEQLFFAISEEYNLKDFDVSDSFRVLNSKNFDSKKTEILDRLHNGNKLFLITTYQTLGAGQNIQYSLNNFDELLKNGKTVKIFERESSKAQKEKDFDAIFLDKPTNLLVHLNHELNDFDVNKRIFQAEMLFQTNKIFYKQLVYEIKRTFKQAYYKNRSFEIPFPEGIYKSFYSTKDYRNYVAKEIIQAIGRINRTNYKNKEIYIYADVDIAPNIKSFDYINKLCLKEFEELIKEAQYENSTTINDNDNKMLIEQNNIYCHNWINSKIKSKYWNDQSIEDWEELREICLQYPTVSQKELNELDILQAWDFIYIPMLDSDFENKIPSKQYYFTQENDYSTVTIDYSGNGSEVSSNVIHLHQLMDIPPLCTLFNSKNYAIDFISNDYIISPQIFNNIYKGALGEVIGKFIFESYIMPGSSLKNLPNDIYERFDFMLEGGIFIDFKFWNDENNQTSRDAQIAKIFGVKVPDIEKKGYEVNKIFIINILADSKFSYNISSNDRLIEIPYLIDKNSFSINEEMITDLQKLLTP